MPQLFGSGTLAPSCSHAFIYLEILEASPGRDAEIFSMHSRKIRS